MRSILITIMLIGVALVIYMNTIGGEDGMNANVRDGGSRVNTVIQSINP